ncbi:hypothetical protein H2202_002080 [Exophiala xenobiotica]|nr:hypothetical protein H2202_002080 [Exophiala xenobiotica]KAK5189709.1 hypothetical protein LTR92_010410 [Exophiala xenobiotica]KAK5230193.1 hypothetical protein LTR72_001728 [Exophiala xenobiotica]KAK5238233.1 hypothetical protein LTR47_001326 [Exophiala xenobiotica]KAK5242987.1 hypothetical protein LTS06_011139 [Exophiala xenobiotica]
MPIEVLPETTTRALGSSLVLNDAKSVVKELVDNALDARATAISIEVSNNTLDIIQVKDNGTGIGVQDRQLLCKRGCTSKIRSLDDLTRLGGSFLGFRGEALASIAELSSAVIVTTRVEGEIAGTSLKYAASGMLSSSSASHPVGTTLRVQDFLTKIPVRQQTAIKNNTKTLQAIKSLLFGFAFARKDVRFSLKVLKAKNNKLSWTYAASQNADLTEIATKVLGKEVASECTPYKISSADIDVEIENGWEVEALIVSADADLTKVRSVPQFISVDGRPVSTERGTLKEIAKSYKHHLQRIFSTNGTSISRPFIYMQIRCPPESYDVNVEAAKDEVLFFRPDLLMSLVESLFGKAYGDASRIEEEMGRMEEPAITISSHQNMYTADLDDVEEATRQEQKAPSPEPADSEEHVGMLKNPFTIAAMNRIVMPKKMPALEKGMTTSANNEDILLPTALANAAPVLTNTHRKHLIKSQQLLSPTPSDDQDPVPYQNPGPPTRPWTKKTRRVSDEDSDSRTSDDGDEQSKALQSGLRSWLTPQSGQRRSLTQRVDNRIEPALGSSGDATGPFAASRLLDANGLASRPSSSSAGVKLGPGQKPFKSPLKWQAHAHPQPSQGLPSPARILGSFARSASSHVNDGGLKSPQKGSSDFPETVGDSASNVELSDIMDFEHRKKAAIAHQRRLAARHPSASLQEILSQSSQPKHAGNKTSETDEQSSITDFDARFGEAQVPISTQTASTPNSHLHRYLAAKRDLSHSHPDRDVEASRHSDADEDDSTEKVVPDPTEQPGLSDDDPRMFLMKQQRLKGGKSSLYRAKPSRLPLETIPRDAMTLRLLVSTSMFDNLNDLKRHVEKFARLDPYIRSGAAVPEELFLADTTIDEKLSVTLREIVKAKYRYTNSDGKVIVPHLKLAISEKQHLGEES